MSLCVCAGLAGGTGAVSVWAAEDNTSAEDTQSDAVQETGEESGEETADPDAVRVGALKGPTDVYKRQDRHMTACHLYDGSEVNA